MTRTLTLARLEALNACRPQLEEFKRRFGAGGEVTLEKCLAVAQVFDWDWAARYLLSPAAKRAYDEAPGRRAYDEAMAAAWRAYNEAMAPVWRAYNEAMAAVWRARNEAQAAVERAYNEAMAPVWRARNEAQAAVERAYNEAMATAFFHAWSSDND
jgi:hypothetical protein